MIAEKRKLNACAWVGSRHGRIRWRRHSLRHRSRARTSLRACAVWWPSSRWRRSTALMRLADASSRTFEAGTAW